MALVVVVVVLLIGMRKVEVTAGTVEEEEREAGDEEGLEAMVWRSSAGALIYVRCGEYVGLPVSVGALYWRIDWRMEEIVVAEEDVLGRGRGRDELMWKGAKLKKVTRPYFTCSRSLVMILIRPRAAGLHVKSARLETNALAWINIKFFPR